ncbi:hypothetical protein [Siccirubricoccus sp. G192]|uniref:hypothetical protein n=1 Tax=Siccirubricoccus sp. G192 TaxID=2849651 RepID=UPI001C2C3E96|nr:hypothetical protein [Siccirubricoccus sp. G192]MBV1795822.1 hypothetical protein [Siccirubricoccus sp. G192]
MREHSMVASISRLNVEGEIIYELTRHRHPTKIRIWLSDAYHFTEMDYHNRPKELKAGDYILIAKPEGGGGVSNQLIASTRIGVGKLNELMGALNVRDMWTYVPPTEEELKARREKIAKKGKSWFS